ncbi:etoposide-induced protein 2.4-domain-containing protein [Lentinula aciculospora]|uniref:Etoposide-induced protein 2.4-domain-containing protein n=1 Tax=Lentinula aciculospora TaxID=153920 RepID=A0A9W9AQ27_9AGAR|nr:etoposide-induced protein 2.4-domain-containing protein [Lentinula aciculospora]
MSYSSPTRSRHNTSARSLYPSFLSVQESLWLQLNWVRHGIVDAFRWDHVISTIAGDSEVRTNVYKSLLLNSLSLTSIYTFDLLLLPLVRDQQKWLHRNVGWFYQGLWLFPVIGLSFYLNSSWCNIIAERTFVLRHGNRSAAQQQPVTYTGMLKSIATSAYRVVMVFTSLVVSFALRNIPFVGPVLGFSFLCWLDSYYLFEFVWIARGMSLSRRIRYLEERWAYYLAFGLPSAALCNLGSGLANAAIFALVFPLYIVMAMHACPVPADPYNPVSERDVVQHPSPFIPIRLPVFAPVMFLNDWIVRVLSVGGGSRATNAHRRGTSDDVESVEEGERIEMQSRKATPSFSSNRSSNSRIKIGRRKMD